MTVTKDTMLSELLEEDMEVAEFFYEVGMHCIGCFASMYESIGDACMVHGIDPDDLVEDLNDYLARKEESKKAQAQTENASDNT